MEINNVTSDVNKMEWIEPEIRDLDVSETSFNIGTGADGQTTWSDCTRS